jgi:hypothetical protein
MIVNLPRVTRRPMPRLPKKVRPLTVAQILREAYRRHARGKITLIAVKRYLG